MASCAFCHLDEKQVTRLYYADSPSRVYSCLECDLEAGVHSSVSAYTRFEKDCKCGATPTRAKIRDIVACDTCLYEQNLYYQISVYRHVSPTENSHTLQKVRGSMRIAQLAQPGCDLASASLCTTYYENGMSVLKKTIQTPIDTKSTFKGSRIHPNSVILCVDGPNIKDDTA